MVAATAYGEPRSMASMVARSEVTVSGSPVATDPSPVGVLSGGDEIGGPVGGVRVVGMTVTATLGGVAVTEAPWPFVEVSPAPHAVDASTIAAAVTNQRPLCVHMTATFRSPRSPLIIRCGAINGPGPFGTESEPMVER